MTGMYIILTLLIVLPLVVVLATKAKPNRPESHTHPHALTGLLSAQAIKDTLTQYRKRTQTPITVFLIAIDRYQGLHAHFPSTIIETIEQHVLNRLEATLERKKLKGTIGLLESNEYCLLLTELSGQESQTLSANMCQAINEHKFTIETRAVSISLSIGTVYSSQNHPSTMDIMSEADFLLQEAQSRGRSYFEYVDMSQIV